MPTTVRPTEAVRSLASSKIWPCQHFACVVSIVAFFLYTEQRVGEKSSFLPLPNPLSPSPSHTPFWPVQASIRLSAGRFPSSVE